MSVDYRQEAPQVVQDFLRYLKTSLDHSDKTINEYYLDLRTFFRFMKLDRGIIAPDCQFNDISISDIDLNFVKGVSKADIYHFIDYLRSDKTYFEGKANEGQGLAPSTTQRRIACLKSFFNFLSNTCELLDKNPTIGIVAPLTRRRLPTYLTEDEAFRLLDAVDGANEARDYCILVLFLNCGLRVSEIVSIDVTDIRTDGTEHFLNVTGKGNKERQVYLEGACMDAVKDYLDIREEKYKPKPEAKNALFLSREHYRISTGSVQYMVKKTLQAAGLSTKKYSAHKLRHTAATLMLQNGVDVRTLQELLGHEQLNTTMIYTHVNSADLRVAAKANPISRARKKK